MTTTALGWRDRSRDDPEVVALREHLASHNGIRGLDIVEPGDLERIVRLFRRDGFVVVADVLDEEQNERLLAGCLRAIDEIVAVDDDVHSGNRGSHRYSFGASSPTRSLLHLPEWQMLVDLPRLTPIITELFGSSDYMVRAAGGDFCLPGAVDYQPLHADMGDFRGTDKTPVSSFSDHRRLLTTRDLPTPYIAVNFCVVDLTPLNGPTRQIPGTQHSRERFPTLEDEPEWMRLSTVCPAPARAVLIRDVRAWHGGTPNLSDEVRPLPNIEFYAPWFREPIMASLPRADHLRLSDHGRHITRFITADSTETLATGWRVEMNPLSALQKADRERRAEEHR